MRVSKGYKEKVKQQILDAAGRGFREEGYGGLGIDGLAKRAGLTSGAFYGHFSSKDEAFKEAVTKGLQDYAQGVLNFKTDQGAQWAQAFLDYYLGTPHMDDLGCGCAVPGLSAEVMRADSDIKKAYEDEVKIIADTIAKGLKGQHKHDAWALMALLAGSVMMARCIENPETSREVLDSARKWAEQIVSSSK